MSRERVGWRHIESPENTGLLIDKNKLIYTNRIDTEIGIHRYSDDRTHFDNVLQFDEIYFCYLGQLFLLENLCRRLQ